MISAISEIETAVQAMKHGAYHYVTKDFDYDQLRSLVRNASERQDSQPSGPDAVGAGRRADRPRVVVGSSKVARDIVDLVHKIAKLSATGADPRRERDGQGAARAAHPPRGPAIPKRRSSP